jgi:anti-sigma factor ChrR (cupin superfamily)
VSRRTRARKKKSMMRVVNLYAAECQLTPEHQPLHTGHETIWVRAQVMPDDADLGEALDAAEPAPGETVLNSLYIGSN